VDWYVEGKIRLDDLVSHRLTLEQINDGYDLMRRGQSIRAIITFSAPAWGASVRAPRDGSEADLRERLKARFVAMAGETRNGPKRRPTFRSGV
jgi:hypothetical protein